MSKYSLRLLLVLLVLLGGSLVWAQNLELLISTHPLNRGLIGWWRGLPQQGSGTVLWDVSFAQNHMTMVGMTQAATGWRAATGRPGGYQHLRYDGSTAYATLAKNPTLNQTQGTIAVWVNRQSTTSGEQAIVSCGDGSAGNSFLAVEYSGTTDVLSGIMANGGTYQWRFTTTANFPINAWNRVVMVVDAAGNRMYVNGALQAVTYNNGTAASVGWIGMIFGSILSCDIGRLNLTTPVEFTGFIDDVRLANWGWGPLEVYQDYVLSQNGDPGLLRRSDLQAVTVAPQAPVYKPSALLPFVRGRQLRP